MVHNLDPLLLSLAVLGLIAALVPLLWTQSGHEYEEFDDDLRGHGNRG